MMTNTDKFIPKIEKTYQVQELEVKQIRLSPAARSKIINKSGSNYQSVRATTINYPSYGPCKWDNPNCSCSPAELERQAAELKVQREREPLEHERKQREREEAKRKEAEKKEAERKRKEAEEKQKSQ